ncbi:retrovirus-related pol polyprotein from transposon TNT 1-94 [Tanacetum coccineum]|uniref:Retrovirus-related pol polyprotein from transposon TNT 1-94 n=1 Tax=Tanacetum coccineum TaxID=301880 RepID=A0ABQ5CK61_9ASTR
MDMVTEKNDVVEASRQLIFSRAPLFLWAEAIATACYTQNRSIIHRRFNKTPYELINGRKPDISFLHVFGALCYPHNDRDDIGKLCKGDIGFFIGYSADSCAYRVYNRRTKKIMETMNVSFDELSAMAFEQSSSKPGLQSMTSGQISSGLDLTYAPCVNRHSAPRTARCSSTSSSQTPDGTTTTADDNTDTNIASSRSDKFFNTFTGVDELHTHHCSRGLATIADNVPNAMFDENTFVNPFATPSTCDADSPSSQYVDPSNMHTLSQPRSTSKRLKGSFVIPGTEYGVLWNTKESGIRPNDFQMLTMRDVKDTSIFRGAQFLGKKLVSLSSKKQDCTALFCRGAEICVSIRLLCPIPLDADTSIQLLVRFHKLVNDMKITQLEIPTHQMNTKFVNNLPAYWGNIDDPLAYVAHNHICPTFSSPLTSSPQPTAHLRNDALMATMTPIANLLMVSKSSFTTNNQHRTSSNSKNHATVHDGQIVTEPIQRKLQSEAIPRRWECTHLMINLSTNTTYQFKPIMEDAYDSDVDEGPNAAVAFMANLSSTRKEKSIAFLQSEKEKILSEKKDLADSYLDEIVCLKNANKVARDILQRFNMPTETIPMLFKKPIKWQPLTWHKDAPRSACDREHTKVLELAAKMALRKENVSPEKTLKAQVTGKTSSGPSTSETPKVLAPGMYNLGSKYIPPPKRANWVKPTPLPKKRQVTFSEPPRPSLKPTQKPVVHPNKQTNVCVPMSTGVKPTSGASKTVPKRAPRNHSSLPVKSANARRVEAHHRTLNKKNRVDSNLLVKHSVSVSNLNNVCGACNKSLVFANHTDCLVMCDGSVNVKPHQTKRFKRQPKKEWKPIKRVWKPISKPVANSKPQWKPTGRHFSLFEKYPLTRIMEPTDMPIELPPSASSSPKITMVSRFTDHKLSDRQAGSKGISGIFDC